MSAIELESLRLLLAIHEEGSLGAAARTLGISQPAVSMRLKAIERRYGLHLVNRSTRGARLTTDGELVLSWARRVINDVAALESSMRALGEERKGAVDVAASLTIAEYLLPAWLAELHRLEPSVHVVLKVMNSEDVLRNVLGGRVDLGFIETPGHYAGVHSRVVGRDRVVVAVSPSHPWSSRERPLSAEELGVTPLVLRERGSGTRQTFEAALGMEPRVLLQADSTSALVAAAVNGVGPAIISEITVRNHLQNGALIDVPLQLNLRRELRAIWRKGPHLSPPAERLLALATENRHEGHGRL